MIQYVIDLIYPSFCLHCHEDLKCSQLLKQRKTPLKLQFKNQFLCSHCLKILQLKEPGNIDKIAKIATIFEDIGPACSLVLHLRNHKLYSLGKMIACYVTLWLAKSTFPLPDVIIPMPKSSYAHWNFLFFVAKHVGKMIKRPVTRYKGKYFWQGDEKIDKTVLFLADTKRGEEVKKMQMFLKKHYKEVFTLTLI
jgi:uncharacterized CHY-type Zn-finger protein